MSMNLIEKRRKIIIFMTALFVIVGMFIFIVR